jgi:hypothetical protein
MPVRDLRHEQKNHCDDWSRTCARSSGALTPQGATAYHEIGEDDLREIARAGYEGAAVTHHDRQALAVALFSPMPWRS